MSSNKIRKLENQKQDQYDGGIFPISPPVTSSIQHLNQDPKPIGRTSFHALLEGQKVEAGLTRVLLFCLLNS